MPFARMAAAVASVPAWNSFRLAGLAPEPALATTRADAVGVVDAELQGVEPAHREPDHVGPLDADASSTAMASARPFT